MRLGYGDGREGPFIPEVATGATKRRRFVIPRGEADQEGASHGPPPEVRQKDAVLARSGDDEEILRQLDALYDVQGDSEEEPPIHTPTPEGERREAEEEGGHGAKRRRTGESEAGRASSSGLGGRRQFGELNIEGQDKMHDQGRPAEKRDRDLIDVPGEIENIGVKRPRHAPREGDEATPPLNHQERNFDFGQENSDAAVHGHACAGGGVEP